MLDRIAGITDIPQVIACLQDVVKGLDGLYSNTQMQLNNVHDLLKQKDKQINSITLEKEELEKRVKALEANVARSLSRQTRTQNMVKSLQAPDVPAQPLGTPTMTAPTLTTGATSVVQGQPVGTTVQTGKTTKQAAAAPTQCSSTPNQLSPAPVIVTAQTTQAHQTSNEAIPRQQPPPLGQLPPPLQAQINNNGIKRGPKSVDHIFIKNVDPREDSVTIGDHIHQWSGIEREHIVVEFQFIRNNNKAFKITVPHGKMQETINVLGTEIKAEPYKDRNHRSRTNGQARDPRQNNTYRSKSLNSFRGPPPTRGPPSRRFNGRPSNWGYATPEWRGWNYPHFY